MASVSDQVVIDCTVAVKWEITGEPHAAEAVELLRDWQHGVTAIHTPSHFRAEVVSAFLRAFRRGRLTDVEAEKSIRSLLAASLQLHELSTGLADRAFAIARHHGQGAFDCIYVALAERERIDLWTGDQRLYNALGAHYPFIRWLAHYQRKRP
jgi:predicted nucleic acid-binding protein